jgi:glycosyltransferase involved in cell wall biosynthesis
MRILVDCHVFDYEFQGSRSVIKGLYSKLFEMESATPTGNIYFLAAKDTDNLKKEFPVKPFIRYVRLKTGRSWQRLILEFPYLIKKNKIDYAHFQYIVPPLKLCKYITTCHDVLFLDFPEHFSKSYIAVKKALYKLSYRYSDIVITVSNYSYNRIQHYFGHKKNFYCISNGIDNKFFEFFSPESKNHFLGRKGIRPYILCISRFEPRKNQVLLLQAYSENKFYQDFDLVLLGNKTLNCQVFDNYYKNLPGGIKSNVHIDQNGVSEKDLLLFMKHAEVFVYPSIAEGFGLPPLEAAALKTPVICNNSSAMADFTVLGRFLIDANPRTLAIALEQVLSGELSVEEKEKIADEIRANYSWDNAAIKFQSILGALN